MEFCKRLIVRDIVQSVEKNYERKLYYKMCAQCGPRPLLNT